MILMAAIYQTPRRNMEVGSSILPSDFSDLNRTAYGLGLSRRLINNLTTIKIVAIRKNRRTIS